jgi:alpha 1,2-mannosyltransferase
MMLKKSEVHFFYDMGYFHNPFSQCPSEPAWLPAEKCNCNPAESMGKCHDDDDDGFSDSNVFIRSK